MKTQEDAEAQLRKILYPNYEPWEKVQDNLDQSDLDHSDVDYMKVNPSNGDSHGSSQIAPNVCNFQVSESSHSGSKREACESIVAKGLCAVGSLNCGTMSGGVGPFV